MMKSLLDLEKVTTWCQTQTIRLCILFGSQATGRATKRSDIDLAIWSSIPPATRLRLRWGRDLAEITDRSVNLIIVSADLDPVLGMEIVRHGRVIYEQTPDLWAHQRLQLWHAYTDSLPFRRLARQSLREFAAEVRRGS